MPEHQLVPLPPIFGGADPESLEKAYPTDFQRQLRNQALGEGSGLQRAEQIAGGLPDLARQNAQAFDEKSSSAIKSLSSKMPLVDRIQEALDEGFSAGSEPFYDRLGASARSRGVYNGLGAGLFSNADRKLFEEQQRILELTQHIQAKRFDTKQAQEQAMIGVPRNFAEAQNVGAQVSPLPSQLAQTFEPLRDPATFAAQGPEFANFMRDPRFASQIKDRIDQVLLNPSQRALAAGQMKALEGIQTVPVQTAQELLQGLVQAGVAPPGARNIPLTQAPPVSAFNAFMGDLTKQQKDNESAISVLIKERNRAEQTGNTAQVQLFDTLIKGHEAQAQEHIKTANKVSFFDSLKGLDERNLLGFINNATDTPDTDNRIAQLDALKRTAESLQFNTSSLRKIDVAIKRNEALLQSGRTTRLEGTIQQGVIEPEKSVQAQNQGKFQETKAALADAKHLLGVIREGNYGTGPVGTISSFFNLLRGLNVDLETDPAERALAEKTFNPEIPRSRALAVGLAFRLARIQNQGGTLTEKDFEKVYDVLGPGILKSGPDAKAIVNEFIRQLRDRAVSSADVITGQAFRSANDDTIAKVAERILNAKITNPNDIENAIRDTLIDMNYLPNTQTINKIKKQISKGR